MRVTKWLKWKIGGILTLSIALIFQIVKTNPQFVLHTADAASSKNKLSDLIEPTDDPVIEEWNYSQDSTSAQQGPRFGRGRDRGSRGQEGSSGRSNLSLHADEGGSDTRTGQS
ncbi:hypothetical protein ACFPYJ_24665 [Paenibacillus solisilvae]|uniref:Uncharacterized protein n=1 Tax=Paenibacillus solisilvae TaxID=2486751 RepID=A0ABW0W462_9BACL